jgi:hypothetical protein
MQEDSQAFMERFIRARAVAPLDPDVPGLPPQERRDWWEFCLEMHEYFGNLIRDREVTRDEAQQLAQLQWILIQGSYVFGTADPALRAEQRRFAEILRWMDGAFAGAVNDSDGVREMCKRMPGPHLIVNAAADALRSVREWTRADSPARTLLEAARRRSAELCETMLSASTAGPATSWPTSADVQRMFDEALMNGRLVESRFLQFPDRWAPHGDPIAGVTARCDLETAFDRAGLSINARRMAYANLQDISREEAPGELHMSKREVQAACKELNRKKKAVRDVLRKKS